MDRRVRLLIPVDFSPMSKHALRAALRMAEMAPVELVLLHVIPEYEVDRAFNIDLPGRSEIESHAERWAGKAYEKYLRGEDMGDHEVRREVRYGNPAQVICAAATELQADLIVIASHGRSGFQRKVFGSVAEKVLRLCDQPIMIVKGK